MQKWYQKAAEQGHLEAQNNMGFCYANGKERYSIVENGKSQTPTVQTSNNLRGAWESLKFD